MVGGWVAGPGPGPRPGGLAGWLAGRMAGLAGWLAGWLAWLAGLAGWQVWLADRRHLANSRTPIGSPAAKHHCLWATQGLRSELMRHCWYACTRLMLCQALPNFRQLLHSSCCNFSQAIWFVNSILFNFCRHCSTASRSADWCRDCSSH